MSAANLARLSLTDQIVKAAAEGNIEKVKELGEKLRLQAAKPKKAAPKPKNESEGEAVIDPSTLDPDPGYITAARSNRKNSDRDEDGRRLATREPFRPMKRKNTFKDTLTDNVADIQFDKSWYEKTGDTSVKREKVKPIKVICTRCKEAKSAMSNDFIHSSWACEDCLKNIRR